MLDKIAVGVAIVGVVVAGACGYVSAPRSVHAYTIRYTEDGSVAMVCAVTSQEAERVAARVGAHVAGAAPERDTECKED